MGLYKVIERLYDKKIDGNGMSIFRMTYCFVFLCEVVQLFYFRHLVFDRIPYLQASEIDVTPAMAIWIGSIVFLIFGLFTRTAAVINYLFSIVFIATINTYEYHMFYLYMGVNFLLIFLNVSKVNSLDRLWIKLKYSTSRFHYQPPRTVSVLNYYVLLLLAVAFVYTDSIFFKVLSHNWMSGLGLWVPGSLPHMTHVDVSGLLNIKWMALGLGYLTVAFEAVYIFVFFRKRWRVPLLIIGLGLHLGIFVVFPIPWFGLGVMAIYLVMVPVSWWRRLREKLSFKTRRLIFFYDAECPLCYRTVIILRHFDALNAIEFKALQSGGFEQKELAAFSKEELLANIYSVTGKGKVRVGIDTYTYALKRMPALAIVGLLISIPGIYHIARWIYNKVAINRFAERCTDDTCGYVAPSFPQNMDDIKLFHGGTLKTIRVWGILGGLLFLIALQLNVSYNSPLFKSLRKGIGLYNSRVEKITEPVCKSVRSFSKVFFGITSHPVFMDSHFNGYNHIIAVEAIDKTGKKHWLPIIDQEGHPGLYSYGFCFVKWTFRVNSAVVSNAEVKDGVESFVAFWAYKHGKKVEDLKVNLLVKKIEIPNSWKYNFLRDQESHPWMLAGKGEWRERNFVLDAVNIEDL